MIVMLSSHKRTTKPEILLLATACLLYNGTKQVQRAEARCEMLCWTGTNRDSPRLTHFVEDSLYSGFRLLKSDFCKGGIGMKDHLGRNVLLDGKPKRIISLVPAITETMYHLGLEKEIVGRTRFCKFPEDKVEHAVNVGGTKDIKLERIHDLKPDLIIAEKEENTKEIVAALEKHYPVFVFEIQHYDDVFRTIEDIGSLTAREKEATNLIREIKAAFDELPVNNGERVGYVIWRKPYMVVGKNTYINSLLERLGFVNVFTEAEGRYPVVTEDDFRKANLDELFLATEPFPFREKHIEEFAVFLPDVKIRIVVGEMFWYGAKMLQAATYFGTFRDSP